MALLPAIHPTVIARREPNLLLPGRKPVGLVVPSNSNVISACLFTSAQDVASKKILGFSQSSLSFDKFVINTTGGYADIGQNISIGANDRLMIVAGVQPSFVTDYRTIVAQRNGSSSSFQLRIGRTSNGKQLNFSWTKAGIFWVSGDDPYTIDASEYAIVGADYNWSTNTLWYMKNRLVSQAAYTSGPTAGPPDNPGVNTYIGRRFDNSMGYNGDIDFVLLIKNPPASYTLQNAYDDLFGGLFKPANDTPYLISVPTGGAITGTGSVASQSSAIAGTAEREITGTSALDSQSSTIAGTGAIGGAITGTASLSAQSSTIAGTGTRVITSAAELVSQASVISGAAERVITGTSAIEAQSSTIAGTGTVAAAGTVTGTGDLDSQSSTISGTGILERTGTGAIAASVASIDATGIITRVGTGALASQASSIAGTGTVSTPQTITGTGSLICGVASISGNQQAPIWTAIARVETVWTEI